MTFCSTYTAAATAAAPRGLIPRWPHGLLVRPAQSRSCPTTGSHRSIRSRLRSTTRPLRTARSSKKWAATLAGSSWAGTRPAAGLAVAMCVALRDAGEPLPRALVLLSPWLDLTCTSPSWDSRFEGDPVLDHSLRDVAERYLDGADSRDPLCSPLFADLSGLPPVLVLVGTHEILYDDSVSFAEAATSRG